jgi:hypothetical protein
MISASFDIDMILLLCYQLPSMCMPAVCAVKVPGMRGSVHSTRQAKDTQELSIFSSEVCGHIVELLLTAMLQPSLRLIALEALSPSSSICNSCRARKSPVLS